MPRPMWRAEWEWNNTLMSVGKFNPASNNCEICHEWRGANSPVSICESCDSTIELFNDTNLRHMAEILIIQAATQRQYLAKPLYTPELWDQIAQRHRQGALGWSENSGWPQLSLIRQVKCFIRQYNHMTWSNMDQVWQDYQAFVAQKEFWCQ